MGFFELFFIAVGLSMDAFAVSICKGLSVGQAKAKHCLAAGGYFGGFQGLMPLIGYLLGSRLERFITQVDHWIVFILLGVIGFNMIRESRECAECQVMEGSFGPRAMLPLAVATSIDALAVGVSMAFMNVDIFLSAGVIGLVAFGMSVAGGLVGRRLGGLFQRRATLAGGVVLIGIGVKILVEHLGG